MRIKPLLVLTLLIILGYSSCKELGPEIILKNNVNIVDDTSYIEISSITPESKNVVVEEFTGVRCPNCPQGHQILAGIKAANPNRIVAISLHPINSLGAPYSFSAQDFRSQKAQDLFDFLGQIGLQPAAGIDRKLFSGETNIVLDKNKWVSKVNQQLSVLPPVNVGIFTTYDSVSRLLKATVELRYTQNVSETNRLTIALTESDIITAQLNGSIIDTFYTHNDVLRDFLTATTGDLINSTTEQGRVIRKTYQRTLPSQWNPNNMHVAAYIHYGTNEKTILQGKEKNFF